MLTELIMMSLDMAERSDTSLWANKFQDSRAWWASRGLLGAEAHPQIQSPRSHCIEAGPETQPPFRGSGRQPVIYVPMVRGRSPQEKSWCDKAGTLVTLSRVGTASEEEVLGDDISMGGCHHHQPTNRPLSRLLRSYTPQTTTQDRTFSLVSSQVGHGLGRSCLLTTWHSSGGIILEVSSPSG